mmetsp:Transcript_76715/g.211942  ORF Transcript_76715/g.211942 Transcript_76715/m.211942 type:complete len:301 (+) Transcript_76715:119-1021(+)
MRAAPLISTKVGIRDVADLHAGGAARLHAVWRVLEDQDPLRGRGAAVKEPRRHLEDLRVGLGSRDLVSGDHVVHQPEQLPVEPGLQVEVPAVRGGGDRHGDPVPVEVAHQALHSWHQSSLHKQRVQQLLALGHKRLRGDLPREPQLVDQDLRRLHGLLAHHLRLQVPRESLAEAVHDLLLGDGVRALCVQQQAVHVKEHVRHVRRGGMQEQLPQPPHWQALDGLDRPFQPFAVRAQLRVLDGKAAGAREDLALEDQVVHHRLREGPPVDRCDVNPSDALACASVVDNHTVDARGAFAFPV